MIMRNSQCAMRNENARQASAACGEPDESKAYARLAIAVVMQAAEDYRRAEKRRKNNPAGKKAKKAADELKDFFLSDWCSLLSFGLGSYILEELDKEMKR